MDHSQLEGVRVVVKTLVTNYDTINGVHIRLTDTTKYESLVEILDISQMDFAIGFVAHENDFWFFNRVSIRMKDMPFGICVLNYGAQIIPSQASMFDFPFQYTFSKRLWPVYLMLAMVSFVAWRKLKDSR
jgi:hypothetical protein